MGMWETTRSAFLKARGHMLPLNCALLLLNMSCILFHVLNRNRGSVVDVRFLTPLDLDGSSLLDRTFQAFTEAMDSSNVTYFVCGGTLLGSWRHHDRIPWDDDIDVMINGSDLQTVSRALQSNVDRASFGLYESEDNEPGYVLQWKFYPRNGRNISDASYRSPYIDIFLFVENETHIWNASPLWPKDIYRKSVVFPLRRRPFGKFMVPAPCNTAAFLEANVEVGMCQSRYFNHLREKSMPRSRSSIKVPCSSLSHLYPFVDRTNLPGNGSEEFVLETLRMENSTLRRFEARAHC